MPDRRNALKILGSVGATCAFPFEADELYAQQEHTHAAGAQADTKPAYFSQAEYKVVAAIAERIIPGAIVAGVPAYIDYVVGRSEPQQEIFREGLAAIGPEFDEKSEAEQLKVLQPLCDAVDAAKDRTSGERFFRAIKSLTSDGYFTSKIGMSETLGYKGPSILAAYPECIHEH